MRTKTVEMFADLRTVHRGRQREKPPVFNHIDHRRWNASTYRKEGVPAFLGGTPSSFFAMADRAAAGAESLFPLKR
ncbi:hypothetical protein B4113_2971 [Geobacillus sp. B4113_201601]|nr:hypothetical protein B4113_2971 [Geobacillus sp. B4113_201601]